MGSHITAERLLSVVDDLRGQHRVAGAQVAVWDGGALIEVASGLASSATGVRMTTDALTSIGSTTKLHTAVLVLQLADAGLLDLDEPVLRHLPDLRLGDPQATAAVTPRHLLSMTSGIDNGSYEGHGRGDDAVARYVAALADLPMTFRPGAAYGYSNASTVVSGRLVEQLTGLPWDVALAERLLGPAGMDHSAVHAEDVIWRPHALGHVPGPDGQPVPHPGWNVGRGLGPAGALLSTAGDLVDLARTILAGGVAPTGERILSEAAVAAMQTPQVHLPPTGVADVWGLGPQGAVWDGERVLGHSGTTAIGSSHLLWLPDRDVAVAVAVNTPRPGYPFAKAVVDHVLSAAVDVRVPPPAPVAEQQPPDLDRFTGTYEMHGAVARVTRDGAGGADELALAMDLAPMLGGTTTDPAPLLPLGGAAFRPTDPDVNGGRGWGVAFTGPDGREPEGRATHLVNGVFCLRRTA